MTYIPQQRSETKFPAISVIIATRNRGARIMAALESILANDYPDFDVWIVDQSDNATTELALETLVQTDWRVHYLRSMTQGCSVGRNIGIAASSGPLVAITDDDCIVPRNWLNSILSAFEIDSRVGIINGNVIAGEHDRSAGFITVYLRQEPFLARRLAQKNQVRGITACMGIRRKTWEAANQFDQMLGVGTPLRSASEGDFIIKALLAGYYVYETPEVNVVHNGFRNWQDYRKLSARYSYGNGALVAKYLKLQTGFALKMFQYEFGTILLGEFLKNIVFRRRLTGITPILAFICGFFRGFLTPLDRRTGNFRYKTLDNQVSYLCKE